MKLIRAFLSFVDGSFFSKIVLLFSAISSVSLIMVGVVVTSVLSNTLTAKELQYENQAIISMGHYIQNMEYQFNQSIYNLTDRRYSDINNYLISEEGSGVYVSREIISGYLNAILNSNEDILDVVLVNHMNGSIVSASKDMRSVNYEYDFANQEWFRMIKTHKNEMTILPNQTADYVRASSEKVLTYARNIYNSLYIKNTQDIGTLIVNYRTRNLSKAIADYKDLKGSIVVMDRNGFVIYDSGGNWSSQSLPFFKQLAPEKGTISHEGTRYLSYANHSLLVNFIIVGLSPVDAVLAETNSVKRIFFIAFTGMILMTFALTVFAGKAMAGRVLQITEAMNLSESGMLESPIAVKGSDEIGRIASGINQMNARLNEYINQVYIAGMKQKTAELAALQAQINPHFLFNTLETLRMEALMNGEDRIAQMILILSNLFRWNIRNKVNTVTVRQEIQYLTYYLELQKYRLRDRLEFSIDVEKSILNKHIIKFSLQPILENAIAHGIDMKKEGGMVKIKGNSNGDEIVFEISDDGVGIMDPELTALKATLVGDVDLNTENIGLQNVNDRIRILYGDRYGLSLTSDVHGTTVKIRYPLLEGGHCDPHVETNHCG